MSYSLLLLGYKPVQHFTVLNTVGNCNTIVSITILYYNITILYYNITILYYNITILYYNIMGPPSYMLSVVNRNVVMRRIAVFSAVTA